MTILRSFLRNTNATAAVEAAIFLPIFMLLTFGITDLGSEMFVRQRVNAAAQAGATYAVINSGSTCVTSNGACVSGIQGAMNDAFGSSTFCSASGACPPPSIAGCIDGSPKCITVTATYTLTPILPPIAFSWPQPMTETWVQPMTVSYTVTVRIL